MSYTQSNHFIESSKYLEGKLLTIIEASTEDKTKREALKSIVKSTLWEWIPNTSKSLFPTEEKDAQLEIVSAHGEPGLGQVVDQTK